MIYYVVVNGNIYEFDTQGKALAYANTVNDDYDIFVVCE